MTEARLGVWWWDGTSVATIDGDGPTVRLTTLTTAGAARQPAFRPLTYPSSTIAATPATSQRKQRALGSAGRGLDSDSQVRQLVEDQGGTPHLVAFPGSQGPQYTGLGQPVERGVDARFRGADGVGRFLS